MQLSPISFGKIYRGEVTAKNLQTNSAGKLNFVEYEATPEDRRTLRDYAMQCDMEDDFSKEQTDYSEDITEDYFSYYDYGDRIIGNSIRFYGIEDRNGKIQCLAETINEKINDLYINGRAENTENPLKIRYIGVRPSNFHHRAERKYSRLGTNMLNEIVKIADKENKGYLWLASVNDPFWTKMPKFNFIKDLGNVYYLDQKDYDKCSQSLDKTI